MNKKIVNFYYNLGGSIVPAEYKGKNPILNGWNKPENKISKDDYIKNWMDKQINHAFLIPENLFIVDIEAHKGGLKTVSKLKKEGIDLKKTFHNITGQKGVHAYYKYSGPLVLDKKRFEDYAGIELLENRHLITIPPSIHPNGKPYKNGPIKVVREIPKKLLKKFFKVAEAEPAAGTTPAAVSNDKKDLKYYLSYIDINNFSTFTDWMKILFSSYDFTGGSMEGLDAFKVWSSGGSNYSAKSTTTYWQAVKNDKGSNITKKSLLFHAHQGGAENEENGFDKINMCLEVNFDFTATLENDGEYVRFIGKGANIFEASDSEPIGGKPYAVLTHRVISKIVAFIHEKSGVYKKDFTENKIKALLESNVKSLFTEAYLKIEKEHPKIKIKKTSQLVHTKKLFFKLLTHECPKYADKIYPYFIKYMLSGVRANLKEYDTNHISNTQTCLGIFSATQGIGKSTFARTLTPLPAMIYYPSLKGIRDSETKLAISRASMCIIDDYQPAYQKELNSLNDILTQHKILVRPKYGRIEVPKTKRAFFALTTNYRKILNDVTGSRRWINLSLKKINIKGIEEIMPKVHAEILSLVRCGVKWYFDSEEIEALEKLNLSFSGSDTLDQILLTHFVVSDAVDIGEYIPLADIFRKLNRAYGNNTIRDTRQLSVAIKRLFPAAATNDKYDAGGRVITYGLIIHKDFTFDVEYKKEVTTK